MRMDNGCTICQKFPGYPGYRSNLRILKDSIKNFKFLDYLLSLADEIDSNSAGIPEIGGGSSRFDSP